ncbi:branched-chain amino acid ABC transporter permease [Agrobacterium tumefaciens]|nr:branched-chain amino acid ABC transporter permease [Agrobacterium tumefaciens]TQN62435.1 branched-chain amino acid ABC transporter permease [Agrobacterium tumefaciens]
MWQGLLQAALSGVVTGCVYALVAVSMVFIYKSSEAVNFAAGDLVMAGAYLGLFLLTSADFAYALAFLAVGAAMFGIGAIFERTAIITIVRRNSKRSRDAALIPIVIATFGLSYIVKGLIRVSPYSDDVYRLPTIWKGPPFIFGSIIVPRQDIVIVVVAIVIIIGFWLFFSRTLTGKALQATSQNARAAVLVGIPIGRMRAIVWAVGACIAGLAGVLLGSKLLITPQMGDIIMLAIAAAVIGGFSNLPGSIVGGITVGVLQNIIGVTFGSNVLAVAPFLVIMIVLVTRPQGLFGGSSSPVRKV